jgi:hypothetical protein
MIRRLRALGRVLELTRCEPATAFVRRKPDHKPCRIGFAIMVSSAFNFYSDSNLMQFSICMVHFRRESARCNNRVTAPVWRQVGFLSEVLTKTVIEPLPRSALAEVSVRVRRAARFPGGCTAVTAAV